MKRLLALSMLVAAMSFAPGSAQARNYDCSKAGNANKAACKGAATAATPAPATAAPKPVKAKAPAAIAAATSAKPAGARNYDCSKAGNANKAVCKGATASAPAAPVAYSPPPVARPAAKPVVTAARPMARPGAPTVAWTTKTGKVVHYDCSKAGNQNKQACKG